MEINIRGAFMEKEQWYSNKELYEKFNCMFLSLEKELIKTRDDVKKYNNLVDKMHTVTGMMANIDKQLSEQVKRCDEVQSGLQGKTDVYQGILKLWPVIISTVLFILAILHVVE